MPQTTQDKRGVLLINPSTPFFESFWPAGNRGSAGVLIARADWAQHGLTPTALPGYAGTTSWIHWEGGASITQNGTFARGVYPDTTGSNVNGGFALQLDESLAIDDIYIQMDVRYPLAAPAKQGLKFLKFFGADGDNVSTFGSANFTFNPQYDNNGIWDWVAFGDGTTTGNDTTNAIFFTNTNPTWIGRSFGLPSVSISRPANSNFQFDSNWHTIKVNARYNTGTSAGNEIPNGRFYVEIDGVVHLDAQGFFNKHPQNKRIFKSLELFGWTQNTQAFTIDYRNVRVSTGGFL